jgi:hypothetical protein
MDDQTRSILQKLLDMNSANTKAIARLQAFNALQTHVILALLGHMKEGTAFDDSFSDSYGSVREAAISLISVSDDPESLNALLSVLDERFA